MLILDFLIYILILLHFFNYFFYKLFCYPRVRMSSPWCDVTLTVSHVNVSVKC